MRIAQVNEISFVASELTRGLRARGHEVDFLQPRLIGGGLPDRAKPLVAPLRAAEVARLAHKLHYGHYDVAQIHYAYLGVTGRLARVPYLLTCHGDDVRGIGPLRTPITKLALGGASHVFYATPDLREPLADLRPDAEFLPNPIDTAAFAPAPEPEDADDVYICCRLDPDKGGGELLEACRLLADRRPEIRISALGTGAYLDEFLRLPNVLVLDFPQPRAKLAGLIARHRVVLGQVHYGAIGMAELEAMACGRPLVASFRHGDAYPEPPPIAEARTGAAIAGAIERLVDDAELRAAKGSESRAWIEHHHALETVAERVEAVALEVLGRT